MATMASTLPYTFPAAIEQDQNTRPPMPLITTIALAATMLLAVYLERLFGWRQALLFIVGTFAGVVLYHASFGFTTSWRVALSDRRSAGLRAQMVMLVLASTAFVILLSLPQPVLGLTLQAYVAPLSLSVVVGAFLFGIGMQLAGGCASGTLYTAGSGNTRMVVTLAAFILGALISTRHALFWATVPSFGPVSLLNSLGPSGAVLATVVVCGGIAWGAARLERARHGSVAPITSGPSGGISLLRGPWPLLWGAVGLVIVNVATLVLAGRPWGITSALALWGAKLAQAVGIDVSSWPYWAEQTRAAALAIPVLADVTSVMDIGIMLGALTAAGIGGKFAPVWRVPFRSLLAAVLGGILLGYGARIAFGCNIGAYFGGVASTSLHGWLWFVSALAGNALGIQLRPWFGLIVERTPCAPTECGGASRNSSSSC
ncbi:MAG: YeeE/YedE family protein [Acidobacteria bacterium]|nr:YeeE/YedE family protein [Acidobacteriota bacterium]